MLNKDSNDMKINQKQDQINKTDSEIIETSPEANSDTKNCKFDASFVNKNLVITCIISSVIASIIAISVAQIDVKSHESNLDKLANEHLKINKILEEKIATIESSLSSIKSDIKANQENSSYIYTNIASLQEDIGIIKKDFRIDNSKGNNKNKFDATKMSADEISFINLLETLINEGAPFEDFVKSYDGKVDASKYESWKKLSALSNAKVKSMQELKKDFANVGMSEFGIEISETFWEKQKRIIKEKVIDAIKIKKTDDKNNAEAEKVNKDEDSTLDDKSLFGKASELISDDKLEDSVAVLEKIKQYHPDLIALIKDANQRINLLKIFTEFKDEFTKAGSKS